MAIEVFNRYENKYLLSARTFEKLERRLAEYMELDEYNKSSETYSITNLYYDTPDSYLIRTSLAKPAYKEKLRMRAYGVPKLESRVYVEIKKKVAGLTNKRRSEITLAAAYPFLQTGALPTPDPRLNTQVLNEIQYMLERNPLRPALYLAYDRRAYFGIGEHDLRISFDRGLRSRRTELRMEAGDFGAPLLAADVWLMEVKSSQSLPLWLARLLAELEIYPTGFSKYGFEYKRTLACMRPAGIVQLSALPVRIPAARATA